MQGFAFCDALDKRSTYPQLVGHGTPEEVTACSHTPWGEVHASLVTLLKGPSLQDESFRDSPLAARLQVRATYVTHALR